VGPPVLTAASRCSLPARLHLAPRERALPHPVPPVAPPKPLGARTPLAAPLKVLPFRPSPGQASQKEI
jgi:hypothetical protein